MTTNNPDSKAPCQRFHATQFADPTPEGIAQNLPAKVLQPLGTLKCLDCGELFLSGWSTRPRASVAAVGGDAELVDEVQRRMDQVVEAAVEWHQAGREGGEWFDAAERLSAAIDSLLELRDKPVDAAECFCGTELEAGLCPNGHDPITSHTTTCVVSVGEQPTTLDEARRLLTECCYTINALADQQAMPDESYGRTLEAVGRFMETALAPVPAAGDGEGDSDASGEGEGRK